MKRIIVIGALLASQSALAAAVTCADDGPRAKLMCFPDNSVTYNGAVRSAPYYTGGPKEIVPTGFTAEVDCHTRKITILDRQGTVILGPRAPATSQAIRFVGYMCDHKRVRLDHNLTGIR
jgi:hypothetical protein